MEFFLRLRTVMGADNETMTKRKKLEIFFYMLPVLNLKV